MSIPYPVNGVIFDFDGTLYGDWKIWTDLIKETLEEFRVNVTVEESLGKVREMIKDGIFYNISGVAIALAKEHGIIGKDLDVRGRFLERLDLVMDEDGPGSELIDLLSDLQRRGVRMGIVTFQRILRLRKRLETWKMTGFFGSLVTPDDVAEFKPSPVPFAKAMRELDIDPDKCVMVGDEPVDMIGASKAGAWTIGFPNGFFTEEELIEAGARLTVHSLGELKDKLLHPKS